MVEYVTSIFGVPVGSGSPILLTETVYVDLFPCNECAKAIIQCGIKEIIYKSDKYNGTEGNVVSKKLLDTCGVKYRQYKEQNIELKIKL